MVSFVVKSPCRKREPGTCTHHAPTPYLRGGCGTVHVCHAYAAAHTGAIGRRSMASVSISCSTRTCVHEPGAEPSSRARIPGRSSLSFWFSSFSLR